MYRNIHPALGM